MTKYLVNRIGQQTGTISIDWDKNHKICAITIVWDNDNSLGQSQLFGTMTIVWDKNNFMGQRQLLGTITRFFSSEVTAAVSTANYCSAAKSPF